MRGRGRPVVFTDDVRRTYLDHVAHGMYLKDAAAAIKMTARAVKFHVRADPQFAAALKTARAQGAAARREALPHTEYRYNHHECRCRTCRKDASTARQGRRAAAKERPAAELAEVIDLGGPPAESSLPSLLLAKAS